MFRDITTHHINDFNKNIKLEAIGPKTIGGANIHYRISNLEGPTSHPEVVRTCSIYFQNCNPRDCVTGVSNEVYLAMLIDRMEGFCSGPFNSDENTQVLTKLKECMDLFAKRSQARVEAGVEGEAVPLPS